MAFSILIENVEESEIEVVVKLINDRAGNRIETFPICDGDSISLGIGIPRKGIDDSLARVFKEIMTLLIEKDKFKIFELYNGEEVKGKNLSNLIQIIFG